MIVRPTIEQGNAAVEFILQIVSTAEPEKGQRRMATALYLQPETVQQMRELVDNMETSDKGDS